MKLSSVIGGVFFLIVLHLALFVSASSIQRSLSDDVRHGISIAGKILGVDSPSNIAVISNIAELVTRAFSNNGNQQTWDRRQLTEKHPTEHLEDFDEVPHNYPSNYPTNSDEQNIDANVIGVGNSNTGPPPTGQVSNGIFGQIIRIMGMDTSKIGALAINGLVFIAQMIGRSFLSAFAKMTTTKPSENTGDSDRSRRINENINQQGPSIWDNTLGWMLEQSKSNQFLSQQMNAMLDKQLPERVVKMIDGDVPGNSDCMKQLICKTTPFIWGMQKAIAVQMNDSEQHKSDTDDTQDGSTDEDDRMQILYKHLPSMDEFKNRAAECEDQYSHCKLF